MASRRTSEGRTSVAGLYAAGETACVSVHGANRLGANSLLDTVIFGKRSGVDARSRARTENVKMPGDRYAPVEENLQALLDRAPSGERIANIRLDMGSTMNTKVQVFREESQLVSALQDVRGLKSRYETVRVRIKGKVFNTDLLFPIELGFMLECAEMICMSAVERKESRGAHSRIDYPGRNDANGSPHRLHLQRQGPKLSEAPVTITRWQPQERKY